MKRKLLTLPKLQIIINNITKILNGELNKNYLITTKIADYYKQLTKIIDCYKQLTKIIEVVDVDTMT